MTTITNTYAVVDALCTDYPALVVVVREWIKTGSIPHGKQQSCGNNNTSTSSILASGTGTFATATTVVILSTRWHPPHNNTIQFDPNQTKPNQANTIRLYSGGGVDSKEKENDDKKEDRTKYNTTQYKHDDDDNNKYVRGYAGADALLLLA